MFRALGFEGLGVLGSGFLECKVYELPRKPCQGTPSSSASNLSRPIEGHGGSLIEAHGGLLSNNGAL